MDYEVRKWLDTGEVEFRIAAVSHRARVGNPLVRLGFGLLGRREQVEVLPPHLRGDGAPDRRGGGGARRLNILAR